MFTYYVITEGSGETVKGLCMIMGEGEEEGGWPYDDISKSGFLEGEIVFKLSLAVLLKLMFFLSQVFH